MEWTQGYVSHFSLSKVDPSTWESKEEIARVNSLSVTRDSTDATPLLETATVSLDMDPTQEFEEGWYRIGMHTTQNLQVEYYPISTLRMESSNGSIRKGYHEVSVDGYSILKPLSDRLIFPGEYVPKGASGLEYIVGKLRESTPAPVKVESTFWLNDYYVFDPGTSFLEAIWNILDSAGWCIQINGHGDITIKERPKKESYVLNRENIGILLPDVDYDFDLAKIPNRYLVTNGTDAACVVNNDPNSRVSYPKRGWYVDVYDSNPVLVNGESLEIYARRMLKAASTITKTWSYTREFVPDLYPFDLIAGYLPEYGFNGNMRILTQKLTLDKGITVTEKVGVDVEEWSGNVN